MTGTPLRLGTLGAARIAPTALVDPARELDGVELVGIAARSRERAERFASRHGVPRVFDDYDALIASTEIDCVYVPLPNGLHGRYAIAALEAGKHVLVEKPFAANADEARAMAAAARASGRVLVEAAHYLYHPLMRRVREILDAGALGAVRRVRAHFGAPFPTTDDIRFDLSLAGGALMDVGFYPLTAARFVVGEEPAVERASMRVGPKDVDVETTASLAFPGGATAEIGCALHADAAFDGYVEVEGERGRLHVERPFLPHLGGRLTLEIEGEEARTEEPERTTSFHFQLAAFVAHVRGGTPMWTGPENAIATMTAIDAIYAAAGLPARRPTG